MPQAVAQPVPAEEWNASGTPRDEVGGLAIFEGVLMRSRTGFAIAQRREDGAIVVHQIPFASFAAKRFAARMPILRGVASLSEMTVIASRAMGFEPEEESEQPRAEDGRRNALLLALSTAAVIALMLVLPELIVSFVGNLDVVRPQLVSDGVARFSEADQPLLFNLLCGALRVVMIVGYVLAISLQADIRRVFEYHGAEHKAAMALERNRLPTVDRAREESVLHPRCGTTFLATVILLSLVVFATIDALLSLHVSGYPDWPVLKRKLTSTLAHLVALPLIVGLSFEIVKLASKNYGKALARWILWPGMMLQRLTTRKPTDHQIEVAIVALFAALAIGPFSDSPTRYVVRGLEDDESAPGFVPRSPARPAGPLSPAES